MRPFMVPFHLFPISSTSYNLLWWSDGKESVRRHWWKTNTPGQKAPCGLGGRVIFSALDEPCIKFRQKSEDFIRLNFLQGNNECCRQNYLAFFFFWCHPFFYSLLLFHWVLLFLWTLLSSIFCYLVYFAQFFFVCVIHISSLQQILLIRIYRLTVMDHFPYSL